MKTFAFPTYKLVFVFLVLLLYSFPSFGGNGTWSKRVDLIDVSTSSPSNEYEIIEPILSSEVTTYKSYRGRFVLDYDRESRGDLQSQVWGFSYWRVKLTYDLIPAVGATQYNKTLTVSYEDGNYVYSDYESFNPGGNNYRIRVTKIEGWRGNSLPLTTSMNVMNESLIVNDLHIRLELDLEKGFELTSSERPTMFYEPSVTTLHWGYVEGAEWYDVEWLFLDAQSSEYAALSTATSGFSDANQPSSTLSAAFNLIDPSPSRVRVWGGSYKLDMIYPEGIVLFRVRSVGLYSGSSYGGMTDQVKPADWTYYNSATSGVTHWVRVETDGFEEDKNWSYGINFAESGKSVSSMSYYDGSMRGRQSMSYNTSDNVTLVGEAKFDYEGRQTVSVIPAPVHGRSFGYRSNFNVAINPIDPSTSIPFDESSFDQPHPLELFPQSSGTDGGAAQYFSDQNNFPEDLFRSAIPQANGYVYSQTVYRNDGTGRIDRVGGIGDVFTSDGTHTTKMYYATPTVTELKRLFGENVPDDLNGYRKTITRDANDQYSVSFYDKRGNVIATGLSGESPEEFRKLEGNEAVDITTSLLSNNSLTADGLTLLAESTIFNEIEGTVSYDFTYDLGAVLQQVDNICYTCAYKLEITILKPDLSVLFSHTQNINQPNPSGCSDPSNFDNFPVFNFSADFGEVGEFRVIKKLTIDQEKMDEELEVQVLANIGTLSSFLAGYTANLDYSPCYDNCDEFALAMAIHKYNQTPTVVGVSDWSGLTTTQKDGFILAQKAIYCTTDGMENVEDEDPGDDMTYTYGLCNGYQHEMENQLKPGGLFYAGAQTNDFWEALQDAIDAETIHIYSAYDEFGDPAVGSTEYSTFAEISNPANFQQEWVALFLSFHPENCHLTLCNSMSASNEFDMDLVQYITDHVNMTTSNALGDLDPESTLFVADRFIIGSPGDPGYPNAPHVSNTSGQFQTAISNYPNSSSTLVDYVLDVIMPNYTTGITPALSTLQLNQISIQAFAGIYMSQKQLVVDNYKATHCAYRTYEGAIFIPSQYTTGDLEAEIEASIAEWTSSNCIDQAVASVNGWMQQFSVDCLASLAALGPPLHTAPAAANPALYTYSELAGTPVRLEQYLYQYALSHCGEYFSLPFYDDGSANYTSIQSILASGSGCAIDFEVTEPESTTSDIINQNVGGCLEELLVEINEHMLPPSLLGVGVYSYTIPSGTINCFPSGVTLTYSSDFKEINLSNGCKIILNTFTTSPIAPFTTIESLSNPVKVEHLELGVPVPYVRVTIHYSDGAIDYGYIPVDSDCNFGNWNTYVTNPTPDIDIILPEWEDDCLEDILEQGKIDGTKAYWDLYNAALAELQNNYIHCLDVPETFDVTYKIQQYQYTLYYYDLVGNLVQTVPPQGVVLLTSAQIAANEYPEHKMATRYGHNGLNAVTESYTPDGGHSQLYLDKLYRVRYSQSAQQADDGKASYSKYDVLGRVSEAGEFKIPAGHVLADKTEDLTYPTTGIMDYTHTYYEEGYTADASIATQFGANGQENLRNAIGAVLHRQGDYGSTGVLLQGTEVKSVMSYSYDPHKNVKQMVSTNYQLQGLAHEHKRVNYSYDLISGNVNEVVYQKGSSDQYSHRYHYDANNRLIRAFTSKNGEVWEMDAKYFYYLHGALARSETGHDKVQGTDYAYNLQGWLKGVNSGTLVASRDLGQDGHTSGLNKWAGVDAVGYQLGYYNGDYSSIVTTSAFVGTTDLTNFNTNPESWASSHSMASLYNGNITHMVSAIRKADENVMDILGNNYQYDQLQRIREMKVYYASNTVTNNNFTGAALYRGVSGESAYQEDYTFDKNGNLLSLKRNGSGKNDAGSTVALGMDNFTYRYYTDYLPIINQTTGNTDVVTTKSNRLSGVSDAQTTDAYTGDIASGQPFNNYKYNKNGQLIVDTLEGIGSIEWTVTGKVKKINFTTAAKNAGKHDVKFIYDPMDMRIAKIEYLNATHQNIDYTYYTYDASGNVMATYERQITADKAVVNGYKDNFYLLDHTIYGSSRIGVENNRVKLAYRTFTVVGDPETGTEPSYGLTTQYTYEYSYRLVGDKNYELSNHLGNVLAVITDRKIELGTLNIYTADVVSYSDYSPYGTLLDGRHGNETSYRYGYQGSEKDDEIKGSGNSYTTHYRMLDPRIGRWFSTDPVFQPWQSPYTSMDNNPISLNDVLGNTADDPPKRMQNHVHYYNVDSNGDKHYKYTDTYLKLTCNNSYLYPSSGDFDGRVRLGPWNLGPQSGTTNVYCYWEDGVLTKQEVFSYGAVESYRGKYYTKDIVGQSERHHDDERRQKMEWENKSSGGLGWVGMSDIVTVPVHSGISGGLQSLGVDPQAADNATSAWMFLGGIAVARGPSSFKFSRSSSVLVGSNATSVETNVIKNFADEAITLTTSSKSLAPSRTYTIYDGSGQLYKFGVSDAGLTRYGQSLSEAGPGSYGFYSSIMTKYEAHISEKYLRSLQYNSTGQYALPGMKIPYPVNFDTGVPIKP